MIEQWFIDILGPRISNAVGAFAIIIGILSLVVSMVILCIATQKWEKRNRK